MKDSFFFFFLDNWYESWKPRGIHRMTKFKKPWGDPHTDADWIPLPSRPTWCSSTVTVLKWVSGKEFSQSDSLKTKRSLRFHSCESCVSQGLDRGSVQGMQNRKAWLCLGNFVILVSWKQCDFVLIAKLRDESTSPQSRFLFVLAQHAKLFLLYILHIS